MDGPKCNAQEKASTPSLPKAGSNISTLVHRHLINIVRIYSILLLFWVVWQQRCCQSKNQIQIIVLNMCCGNNKVWFDCYIEFSLYYAAGMKWGLRSSTTRRASTTNVSKELKLGRKTPDTSQTLSLSAPIKLQIIIISCYARFGTASCSKPVSVVECLFPINRFYMKYHLSLSLLLIWVFSKQYLYAIANALGLLYITVVDSDMQDM